MTDYSRIDAYVLRLIEESTPERTAWNLEKIREGKKVEWNYIDGCMLTALMEMTSITGDERYAAFAEKVIDHFVQEDGNILTLKPDRSKHSPEPGREISGTKPFIPIRCGSTASIWRSLFTHCM